MIRWRCRYALKTTKLILAAQSLPLVSHQENVLRPVALLFAERWNETHFLELGEQAEQHFLRVHPLQETVPARFSGIGHYVVLKIEDGFAERPRDRGFKGIIEETVPLDESLPDRAFVGHKLC